MSDRIEFLLRMSSQPKNPACTPPDRSGHFGRPHGFSLIEMMIVMLIITIIMGAVFKSISITQQTSASQQVKLDLTQQAREFMDQLTRDLRSAGYPNWRNTDPTSALASTTNQYNAPGLIYIDSGALWFAGAVDGTELTVAGLPQGAALVKIIRYDLVAAGPNCPCLRRTEFLRNGGDPVVDASNPGAAVAQMEIQGVQNGTPADPIFTAYDPTTGTPVTLPIDFTNNATTMAKINSLKVVLAVQAQQQDYTHAFPVTRVVSSIALSNCSEALGSQTLSC
jgi:prepilin-type N-terminal cleavage/methylation domain-containing protein